MGQLTVRNWDRWQSYRRDRGQPPWIKVWRRLNNDPDWIALTDAQKGQLVSLWVIAADKNGVIPDDNDLLTVVCRFTDPFDLEVFVRRGWLDRVKQPTESKRKRRRQPGADASPSGRVDDRDTGSPMTTHDGTHGATSTPEVRGGQRRAGQRRTEGDPFEKENTTLTGGGGSEPPPGALGLEGRAPPADHRGNGADTAASDESSAGVQRGHERRAAKLEGYRKQLDALGVAWSPGDTVEQLGAKLAAALNAREARRAEYATGGGR